MTINSVDAHTVDGIPNSRVLPAGTVIGTGPTALILKKDLNVLFKREGDDNNSGGWIAKSSQGSKSLSSVRGKTQDEALDEFLRTLVDDFDLLTDSRTLLKSCVAVDDYLPTLREILQSFAGAGDVDITRPNPSDSGKSPRTERLSYRYDGDKQWEAFAPFASPSLQQSFRGDTQIGVHNKLMQILRGS